MTLRSPNNDDIFLLDAASGRFDRFSFAAAEDESPVWSPDGRRIAYSSAAVGEQRRIFVKPVDAGDSERLLYTGKRHLHIDSWSPDGRWLSLWEFHPRSWDCGLLNVEDPTKLVPVATTPANEGWTMFSPDGRWLTYSSDETGQDEVYVVSFPGLGAKQQVSRGGGRMPRWSASGQELFFFQPFDRGLMASGRMMIARRVGGGSGTAWQEPQPLFEVAQGEKAFVPAANGRTLYFVAPNPEGPACEIHVVVNWLQEVLDGNATATP